jgi:hypothetical protein
MSHSYGAAERTPARASTDSALAGNDSSALVGTDGRPPSSLPDGHASMISAVGNLTNTIIGSGALSVVDTCERAMTD